LIENLHTAVVDYQALHERLGHTNDKKVAATAKQLGIKYTGQPRPCEHCAQAKLNIKNFPKVTTHIAATDIGERIMFDISSVTVPTTSGNKYWLLVMDEYLGYLCSYFIRYRDDLAVTMTAFVKDKNIVRFRCDNAGENKLVDYHALHERFGHANDKKVAATAKQLRIKFTGPPPPCEHCAQAKLRINNIPKVTTHIAATDIG
jgi:D-alanine-D-alanine ligase-like ATP-grasp enzyme